MCGGIWFGRNWESGGWLPITVLRLSSHPQINSGEKSNKCNQCDYLVLGKQLGAWWLAPHHSFGPPTFFLPSNTQWRKVKPMNASSLRINSGEKSSKCNQCDYASSWASNLGQEPGSSSQLQLSSDQSGSDSLLFWTKQRVSVKKAIY